MNTVDFLVPTTSRNTKWVAAEDTLLYKIFFNSLGKYRPDCINHIIIGYDEDDKIFSKEEERLKFIKFGFEMIWIPNEPDPGNCVKVWNNLAKHSSADYMFVCGDDIHFPNDKNWLRLFMKNLKKNNNYGWAAGWSNNDRIATQFLIHKKHLDYFGWIYPPSLTNYFCDDFMHFVYPEKYRMWRKDYPLLNLGGTPRYIPLDDSRLCSLLLKREQKLLANFLREKNNR